MSKRLKLTAAFLAAVLFMSAVVSCGGSPKSVTDTAAQADIPADPGAGITEELKPDLPESDFGGYDFRFLNGNTASWMTIFVVTAAEQNGEAVNDALYTRNLAVSEKYGVKISEISTTSVANDAKKSVAAGDNNFDVALITMADAIACVQTGAATDFEIIPYIDLEKPWWIQNAQKYTSIGNKIYYALSQFDTSHYDGVRGLYFNKTLRQNFELDDPYQLVADNKWVIEKMGELGAAVAQDLDGDGKWTKADRYGYTSWYAIGGEAMIYGIGSHTSLAKDENDMPYFDMNESYHIERFEAVARMFALDGFKHPSGDAGNNGGVDFFKNDQTLFYNECMGNIQKLRTMDTDFGIIPSPKYNEEQEEYYHLGGNPYFMQVPVTTPDLERTGILMEALAYESMKVVPPAFYDIMLTTKIARDNESSKMLDIVFSSLSYYLPVALNILENGVTDLIWKNNTDFASFFAKNESKISAAIEDIKAYYNL
ncbi:MAG TPA: hypothetical protein GX704_06355 [Clostridiales bacterium]|jgi:hypothetical protein|nr:hypothetical protein [Clostridiales bacterium]